MEKFGHQYESWLAALRISRVCAFLRNPFYEYECSLLFFYNPEPTVLLFRRPLGTAPTPGLVNPELAKQARAQFRKEYGLDD